MLIFPEPTNRLSIFSSDLVIGSLAELQINLSDTSGLQAIDLLLGYDKSIFSIPTSSAVYTSTTLTSGWTFLLNTNVPGQINISGFSISPLGTNSGTLINLNLEVNNGIVPGLTTLKLLSASLNEEKIPVSLDNLTVQTNYGSHNISVSPGTTSIPDWAYFDSQLNGASLPDSIETIGIGAFKGNYLENIILPEQLEHIGDAAFAHNKLNQIIIPESVTSIGERAFTDNQLIEVKIPSGVVSIGKEAFKGNKIENVILPRSVKSLGPEAFDLDVKIMWPSSIALGDSAATHINLQELESWVGPDSAFISGVPTDEAYAVPIYAHPGSEADLITFDSLSIDHNQPRAAERAIFLSNEIDLSNYEAGLIPENNRYGTTSDGIYDEGFVGAYAFFGQYTAEITFEVGGKNKFTDVISDAVTGGSSADGTLDLYLSHGNNGDAFFLHDAFSAYHQDVVTQKDAFNKDYAARIENINSIYAGDADDIIDLTTTEAVGETSGGGVNNVFAGKGDDIVLGSQGKVHGEDGDDTLISHHSTVMNGGSGADAFGFIATPGMQDSLTGLMKEPIHRIEDFETGVDSIRFYVSSDLESTGSMQTANTNHITKTTDGDLKWMYFHADTISTSMTIEMNNQPWIMDDIDFITYTPLTPGLG